jgi:hypothetical protein
VYFRLFAGNSVLSLLELFRRLIIILFFLFGLLRVIVLLNNNWSTIIFRNDLGDRSFRGLKVKSLLEFRDLLLFLNFLNDRSVSLRDLNGDEFSVLSSFMLGEVSGFSFNKLLLLVSILLRVISND